MKQVNEQDTAFPIVWDSTLSSSLCKVSEVWCDVQRALRKLCVELPEDVFCQRCPSVPGILRPPGDGTALHSWLSLW